MRITATNELKPCPFCGGAAFVSEDDGMRGQFFHVWHDCPEGGDRHLYGEGVGRMRVETAWYKERQQAIDVWNGRA